MTGWVLPAARVGVVTVSDLSATTFRLAEGLRVVCEFVQSTGDRARIGSLNEVFEVTAGTKGTQVQP